MQAAYLTSKIARKVQKAVDHWAMDYWHKNPLGNAPQAGKEEYLSLWEEAKAQTYPEVDGYEKEVGFTLDKEWLDDLALHTQIVIKDSKLCYPHGRVLYAALRDYVAQRKKQWDQNKKPDVGRAISVFETGTSRGFSSVCMARAMADENCAGKIVTLDLLPHHEPMYWNCIDDHEGMKSRAELLAPWQDLVDNYIVFIENDSRIGIKRTALNRIHFAFLDAAHTLDDVLLEFDMVQRRQQKGDVIVFDDYNPSLFPGVIEGVDTGCEKWGYNKKVIGSRDDRAYVIAQKKA